MFWIIFLFLHDAFPPGCKRQSKAPQGNALNGQTVVLHHLFQCPGDVGDVVHGQAGDAEFPVVLDHIQVQGIPPAGLQRKRTSII